MKTKPNSTRQLLLPFMFQFFRPPSEAIIPKTDKPATRPRLFFDGPNGRVFPEIDWCGVRPAHEADFFGKVWRTPTDSLDENGNSVRIPGCDFGSPNAPPQLPIYDQNGEELLPF